MRYTCSILNQSDWAANAGAARHTAPTLLQPACSSFLWPLSLTVKFVVIAHSGLLHALLPLAAPTAASIDSSCSSNGFWSTLLAVHNESVPASCCCAGFNVLLRCVLCVQGGAVLGGYNPLGFDGYGKSRLAPHSYGTLSTKVLGTAEQGSVFTSMCGILGLWHFILAPPATSSCC